MNKKGLILALCSNEVYKRVLYLTYSVEPQQSRRLIEKFKWKSVFTVSGKRSYNKKSKRMSNL